MAVKTLQITQTGSPVQLATVATFARWIIFQNNAAAAARVGDASVTATRGYALAAANASPPMILQPMPNGAHYDLAQYSTIGTSTNLLDVIYDAMN
jgi:hypothetical protein